MHLDAHERPPASLKEIYKKHRKQTRAELEADGTIADFRRGLSHEQGKDFRRASWHERNKVQEIFNDYLDSDFARNSFVDDGGQFTIDAHASLAVPGE